METSTAFSARQQQFSAGKLTSSTVLGSRGTNRIGAEPVLPTPPDVELSAAWQQYQKLYEYHLQTKGRTPTTICSQRSIVRLMASTPGADGITEPAGITKAWLTGYLLRQYDAREPGAGLPCTPRSGRSGHGGQKKKNCPARWRR